MAQEEIAFDDEVDITDAVCPMTFVRAKAAICSSSMTGAPMWVCCSATSVNVSPDSSVISSWSTASTNSSALGSSSP